MISSRAVAIALSSIAFGVASVLCAMHEGPLSTTAVVKGKVSSLPVPDWQRRRGGGDWQVGIGWTPRPLRALALLAEVEGEPYPALRSAYLDFDGARCRAEGAYAERIGQPAGAVVRGPGLLPGDVVILECTSGFGSLTLRRRWSCTRLCVDGPVL